MHNSKARVDLAGVDLVEVDLVRVDLAGRTREINSHKACQQ